MMTPGPLPRSLRERLTAINSTSRVSILFTAHFTAVKAVTTCRALLTLPVESLYAVAIAVGAQVRLRNKPQTHAPAAASDGITTSAMSKPKMASFFHSPIAAMPFTFHHALIAVTNQLAKFGTITSQARRRVPVGL